MSVLVLLRFVACLGGADQAVQLPRWPDDTLTTAANGGVGHELSRACIRPRPRRSHRGGDLKWTT